MQLDAEATGGSKLASTAPAVGDMGRLRSGETGPGKGGLEERISLTASAGHRSRPSASRQAANRRFRVRAMIVRTLVCVRSSMPAISSRR